MKKLRGLVVLLGFLLSLSAPVLTGIGYQGSVAAEEIAPAHLENEALSFTGQKQLVLEDLDHLGRAQGAHIQLQEKDTPTKKREPRLKYSPVGWHNYKFHYELNNQKKSWLMHRGHLIGYQFSGLSDEKRNLVPMTAWLNAGNYKGTDDKNQDSMLYYENRLDSWLATHPNCWLDLRVTPLYTGDELLPRQIRLQYVGLTEDGQLLPIRVGGKETELPNGVTEVLLDNHSANAVIDYATGRASQADLVAVAAAKQAAQTSPQVESAQPPVTETPTAEAGPETATPVQESRIVYIARDGKADVYWYFKENMPSNTRMDRVVEMTEEEAQMRGKRHTTKE